MKRFLVFHPFVDGGEEIVSRHRTLRGAIAARRNREVRWAYDEGIIGIYAFGLGRVTVNGR